VGSSCHNPGCAGCDQTCSNAVCLVPGVEYTLYVCLTSCTFGNCEPPVMCQAVGEVHLNHQTVTCP
jgi:hypothetical protein